MKRTKKPSYQALLREIEKRDTRVAELAAEIKKLEHNIHEVNDDTVVVLNDLTCLITGVSYGSHHVKPFTWLQLFAEIGKLVHESRENQKDGKIFNLQEKNEELSNKLNNPQYKSSI